MRLGSHSLVASALALSLLFGASPAASEESAAHNHAREFWADHGVSEEVQDSLIEKIERTGSIDAFDAFAKPVSVDIEEFATSSQWVSTFEDGSISVAEAERPAPAIPGQFQPRGIAGCQGSSGSGYSSYTNCVISANDGYRDLSFRANYSAYSNRTAEITSTWGPVFKATLGTMTTPTRSLYRAKASVTQNAVAKYQATWTSYNNASSETIYLAFWLTNTGSGSVGRS